MVTTRPPKTIVKPTALGPVANTDTKLLIYGLFQKGRVLAQDAVGHFAFTTSCRMSSPSGRGTPLDIELSVDNDQGPLRVTKNGLDLLLPIRSASLGHHSLPEGTHDLGDGRFFVVGDRGGLAFG